MRLFLWALSALWAIAAAPAPQTDEALPVPPIPPAVQPADEAAPVPDVALRQPTPAARSGLNVSPSLFNTPRQFRGDGYTPNSSAQAAQERQFRPIPGLNLQLPLP
jgi:hypothetical protein